MKRVLVTGCSSGLGRALAEELTRRGHVVVAAVRRQDTIDDLDVAQRLTMDVCDDESVRLAIAAAGPIDVLVNNAGLGMWGPVEAANEEDVRLLFETNVFGPLRVARAALPAMRERGDGSIYQISSAAAQRSNALLGHYAASKAALEAYSCALRIELAGFGISVCNVILGPVETRFGANRRMLDMAEYAPVIEAMSKRIEGNRRVPATPEQVASVIADSIDTGAPPMRLHASTDAEALVAERRNMDDVQWERQSLAYLNA